MPLFFIKGVEYTLLLPVVETGVWKSVSAFNVRLNAGRTLFIKTQILIPKAWGRFCVSRGLSGDVGPLVPGPQLE